MYRVIDLRNPGFFQLHCGFESFRLLKACDSVQLAQSRNFAAIASALQHLGNRSGIVRDLLRR